MNPETSERILSATEQVKPLRQKLSVLLRDVPAEECCLILSHFESAVMRGIIKALPLSGQHFGKVVIKVNHRKILNAMVELSGAPKQKFKAICSAVDKLDKVRSV